MVKYSKNNLPTKRSNWIYAYLFFCVIAQCVAFKFDI